MKLSFYVSLLFLILYLASDALMVGVDGGQRPLVQLFAGMGLLSMIFYNLVYVKKVRKIFSKWSFLLYWGLFVLLIVFYYAISFYDLPTEYASSLLRNAVIAVFIYSTIIFVYNSTVNKHLYGTVLSILLGALFLNGLIEIFNAFTFTKIRGGIEQINTSAGYVFVMILPLLMYRYRKENIWIYGLTFALTLLTGKRGAMVIYIILLLYAMMDYGSIKKQGKLNWRTFLFIGLLFIAFVLFFEMALESFQYRLSTFQKESGAIGSGRNIIWFSLISHWLDSHFAFKLIGSGFYSTINIMKFVAHNDIIQYLIDYGIIGLSIWLLVMYKFYDDIQRIKTQDKYIYLLLFFCLIILIGRGLFSGTLRTDTLYLAISIGYLLGIYQLKNGRYFIRFEKIETRDIPNEEEEQVEEKANAFIIGAQKAGTTSLYDWLGQHSEVYAPSEIKDYHFFSNDNLFKKGISHFDSLYSKEKNAKVRLHAAVNYIYFYKKAAKRIYEYNSNSKIIICLREPVDRSISAYKYFKRLFKENRSFEDAIECEIKGELSEEELPDFTYLGHGNYHEQIRGFLDYFEKNQIHIVLFEELVHGEYQTNILREISNFLEIDDSYEFEFTHLNKSGKPKSFLINWLIRDGSDSFKWFKNIIPFKWRKSIGNRLIENNISDKETVVTISDNTRDRLKKYYSESVQQLNSLVEKDVTKFWKEYR